MQFKYTKTNSPNKRTAPCTSFGSITVEAALGIPLFLFAALCLVYLLEIHAIQTTVQMAAHTAAKEVSQQMAVLPEVETIMFRNNLIRAAGADRIERSMIVGGCSGIQCWKTQVNAMDQIDVCVEYRIKIPFPFFDIPSIPCKEEFKAKCWTGYQKGGSDIDDGEGNMVYVAENGSVYHSNYECAHLNLSIQYVSKEQLKTLKNESGSHYDACEKCIHFSLSGGYYITDYGEKYHSSLSCSGLKRTVYSVEKGSVVEMGGCSKCTK